MVATHGSFILPICPSHRHPWPSTPPLLSVLLTFALMFLSIPMALAHAQGDDAPTVTIGVVADNEPYTFFEGRTPRGFSVDVLRLVEQHSDVTFEFRAGSWPDIYSAFMKGELDAIDGISWRPDRAKNILFTKPYHYREIYLMRDTDNPLPPVNELEDLKGLRVGVVENIFYGGEFQDAGFNANTYDSLPSLVRALAFGWIDVAVGPRLTLEYLADQNGFQFLQLHGPAPLSQYSREDFRVGVLATNPELLNRIQAGLDAIPESRIQNLLQRWQEFGGAQASQAEQLPLTADQKQYLTNLGPVRVGFMDDYAPFSFTDGGRVMGLSVDVMNRLSDLTGIQVIPVRGQWPELISMLQGGEIDAIANISYQPERESLARFTSPYHVIPNVVFTTNPELKFRELADLQAVNVGLGSGIYYEGTVRMALPDSQVQAYASQEAIFQALANGDVDAVISALPAGNYWIRELGISGARIAGELKLPGIPGEDLRFGVRPSLAPLASILDQAMGAISPKERRVIENRWLGASNGSPAERTAQVRWNRQEQQWLQEHNRQIRVCVDPNWLPLEGIRNGEHVGLSSDVLTLFSERGDLRFNLVPGKSWMDAIDNVRKGHCDLVPLAMKTPARESFLDFTSPYLEVPTVLVGRIDTPFIDRVSDLGDQPVGIVEGYAFGELLRKRNPTLNLVTVSSEQEGLRQVQNRELAAYISTLATASYYMQSLGLADLKVIGRVPSDWSLSIATGNDDPVLGDIMQKLVASLTTQERQQLESNWRNLRITEQVDYTLLWQILAGAVVITLLLVYWNRKLGRLNRQLGEANAALSRLSVTDNLTDLGNRTYFDREFPKSFQWCQRHEAGFAVAMVDADLFKNINDTWGHETGDQCLKTLAEIMREHFRRETDRIARFGGEEFIIFTSYEKVSDIMGRLESFRRAVTERPCDTRQEQGVDLTVSIGLSWGIPMPDSSPSEFLRLADQALYRAKHNGRNRLEATPVADPAIHGTDNHRSR